MNFLIHEIIIGYIFDVISVVYVVCMCQTSVHIGLNSTMRGRSLHFSCDKSYFSFLRKNVVVQNLKANNLLFVCF